MKPDELARKWMEIAGYLQAEVASGVIHWDHQGVRNSLDRTGDSVSLTQVTTPGVIGLNDYAWEGLTDILWIDGHKVALVFERDGKKTTVTISKDSSPNIVGPDPVSTSHEGTVS